MIDKIKQQWFKYIENPIRQVIRGVEWFVHILHKNYDYDYSFFYSIVGYKLKRMQKAITRDGVEHEPKDLKALRLAIKLCSRLAANGYGSASYRKHEEIWGELQTAFVDIPERPGYSTMTINRANVVTENDKVLERAQTLSIYQLECKLRARDKHVLFSILKNHLDSWWV